MRRMAFLVSLALGVLYTFFQYANYSIPQDSGSEEGKNIVVIPAVWIAGEIVFGDEFFLLLLDLTK